MIGRRRRAQREPEPRGAAARQRAATAAMLAYPPTLRAELGAEMTATVLDVSTGSQRRLARELVELVRHGVRRRGLETARVGPKRLVLDGLALTAVWMMTFDLSTLLAQRARGMHDPLLAPTSIALLGVALALALVGWDRLAGTAALVWMAARFPALLADQAGPALTLVAVSLPSLLCFLVLVLAPRRRARDLRRLAWLIVPVTLVLTFAPLDFEQSPLLRTLVLVASLLVVAYAVVALPFDPRVAIAGAVMLSCATIDAFLPLAAAAPLVLAIAVARTRQLQRSVRE